MVHSMRHGGAMNTEMSLRVNGESRSLTLDAAAFALRDMVRDLWIIDLSSSRHGAVFAEVRVDPDLGTIRCSRFAGAYGAGRMLNPRTSPRA
jgi:CO/xanthine dehydrogenase Mo-binding subunit